MATPRCGRPPWRRRSANATVGWPRTTRWAARLTADPVRSTPVRAAACGAGRSSHANSCWGQLPPPGVVPRGHVSCDLRSVCRGNGLDLVRCAPAKTSARAGRPGRICWYDDASRLHARSCCPVIRTVRLRDAVVESARTAGSASPARLRTRADRGATGSCPILLPGLVNTHAHSPMTLLGVGAAAALAARVEFWPAEASLRPSD